MISGLYDSPTIFALCNFDNSLECDEIKSGSRLIISLDLVIRFLAVEINVAEL